MLRKIMLQMIPLCGITAISALCILAFSARAEDTVQVSGKVFGPGGREPLSNVQVVVYDEKDKVIAQALSSADGVYSAKIPVSALHLPQMKKSVGLIKLAGSILTSQGSGGNPLGNISPLGSAVAAAATGGNIFKTLSAATTNRIVERLLTAGWPKDRALTTVADLKSGKLTRPKLVEQLKGSGLPPEKAEMVGAEIAGEASADGGPPRNAPGALQMRAALSGYNDVIGVGQVYLLREDSQNRAAWIDPIMMTTSGAEQASGFMRGYLMFTAARIDPTITKPGQKVTIAVTLPVPAEPEASVLVIARNNKTGEIIELEPGEQAMFAGEFVIDMRAPKSEQVISILAYVLPRGESVRNKKIEEAIDKAGLWKTDKPFQFNPMLPTSRNRADLKFTVID